MWRHLMAGAHAVLKRAGRSSRRVCRTRWRKWS